MRHDVIAEQKALGRRTVVALPIFYPRELLTAMEVHVVELWGPPAPPRGPEAGRLPPCVCPVVRNALAFLASGGADAADAILFPHTCDSLQGLATLLPDFGPWQKPVLRYFPPRGEPRPAARAFFESELRALAADLERWTGSPLSVARLSSAISLHREIDRVRSLLLSRRPSLPLSDRDLYGLLRRGEFLWPEQHLAELQDAARLLEPGRVQAGVPLMVSGIVPEPMALFDHLASAGAFVAADDYAAVGRRLPLGPPACGGDPFALLSARFFALPPCPTRAADQTRRMNHLAEIYRRSGAAGLLLHVPKFCEPEAFDVPAVFRRFSENGAPVLLLETELEAGLSAHVVTRLEAFVELARGARRP
jgi:benzoyl-CoA reductase/2-hydroxyglutaryl-CoA dehydratase subunit BcrC/BadD/HgdB